MRRKKKAKSVGDLILNYAKSLGKEDEYLQAKIINQWPNIVGKAIANYTEKIYFNNKILFIKITSPALKDQMFILREDIKKKINNYIHKNMIKDIVFI